MKKQLLFLLTIILSLNCYSQISFEKGYYINNTNQKINCQIKNIDWKNNPSEFEYRLSENSEPQIDKYYEKEIDDRVIKESFNLPVITETLKKHSVFTKSELEKLTTLQEKYTVNIEQLSENEYKKELDRLAIDLSWKSSQIEGNTYSLLETERLIKERETASGKTKEEATMLLNHKDALDFIINNTDYLHPLSVSKIEDIHSVLIKELTILPICRTV